MKRRIGTALGRCSNFEAKTAARCNQEKLISEVKFCGRVSTRAAAFSFVH